MRALACAAALTFVAASARAQGYGARAEVERPLPAGSEVDPSASATTVDARNVARAAATLDDVLLEVPGARTVSLGAFGAFRTVRLRGARAEHTTVTYGDVPLEPVTGGAFDLGTIPLDAIERVEVHRGGAASWLGASGIGGVLRVVPREATSPEATARFSLGSFGLRALDVAASADAGSIRSTVAAGATSSDGDFAFDDDHGTPLDPSDDGPSRRTNGALAEGRGFGRVSIDALGGQLELIALAVGRSGGIPGPAVQQTAHVRQRSLRSATIARFGRSDADTRYEVALAFGHERRAVSDRFGEIGLVPREADDDALRAYARAAIEHTFAPWIAGVAVVRAEHVRLDPRDALAVVPNAPSNRSAGAIAIEPILRPGWARLELRPSARLEVVRSSLSELRAERGAQESVATTLAPTFRFAAVLEPLRGLATSATIATSTRPPTMYELFGDRGYVLGDVRLRPERATSIDTSAVLRGREGVVRGSIEARGFAIFAQDLVQYVRTSQYQASPSNVESARSIGAELGGDATLADHVRLAFATTWLDARAGDRRLALTPELSAYVRSELLLRGLGPIGAATLFCDVTHLSSSFADAANLVTIDARTLFGAGARATFLGDHAELALTVRDLFDARGQDVMGFPLPGRSFALELTLREDLPR